MATFPPPPYRSTVTERTGLLNWSWAKWFQDFFTAVTGAVDNGVLESFDWSTAKDWSPAISLEVDARSDPPRTYDPALAEIRAAGAFTTDYAGQLADRVAAIEGLVASLAGENGALRQSVTDLQQAAAIADPARPPQLYMIQDTIANQGNYAAKATPNAFYYATDSKNLYVSDGTNWNLTT